MKQPGLVNSALIFNTTYNWYSISRKYNHHSTRLTEELEKKFKIVQGITGRLLNSEDNSTNTTYNWYSISRKYNHHSTRLTEELEKKFNP